MDRGRRKLSKEETTNQPKVKRAPKSATTQPMGFTRSVLSLSLPGGTCQTGLLIPKTCTSRSGSLPLHTCHGACAAEDPE